MRTVYLGTSEFAATVLRRAGRLRRTARRSSSPRPTAARGRGRKLTPPPAAAAARELGIELLQAENVNDEPARERIAAAAARGGRRLRLRPADPRAAALRATDAERPSLAAAALARRGADRAGDHGRRRAHRRLRDAADRRARLRPGGAARGGRDRRRRRTSRRSPRRLAELGGELLVEALDLQAEGELEFERAGRGGGHLRGEDRRRPSAASTRPGRRPSWRRRSAP